MTKKLFAGLSYCLRFLVGCDKPPIRPTAHRHVREDNQPGRRRGQELESAMLAGYRRKMAQKSPRITRRTHWSSHLAET